MSQPLPRRFRFAVLAALRVLWLVAAALLLASPARATGNPRFDVALGGGLGWLSGQTGNAYDHGHNAGVGVTVRTGLGWLEPRILLRDETFHLDGSKLTQQTSEVQIVSGSHRVLSGGAELELHRTALPPVRPYFTLGPARGRVRDELVWSDASTLTWTASHFIVTSAAGLRFRPDRVGGFAEIRWSRILSRNGDLAEFIRTSSGLTLGLAIRP